MEITLINSNQKIDWSNRWFYIGTSYLSLIKNQKLIKGKRVSLRKELHNEFKNQKFFILNWLEKQRKANNDSLNWWMSHIAGRNNVYTKFFNILCQTIVLKKLLSKDKSGEKVLVVCEDTFVMRLVYDNLHETYSINRKSFYLFFLVRDYFKHLSHAFKSQLGNIKTFFLDYCYAKITKRGKIEKPIGKVNLIHCCLDTKSFLNSEYFSCRYFTIFPRWLSKRNERVFILPWLFNVKLSRKKIFERLRKENTFVPEDWLSILDYFRAIYNGFKSTFLIKKEIVYPNLRLDALIDREHLIQLGEKSAIFWRYIPALERWGSELSTLIYYDQFYNMMHEHPIRYFLKNASLKSVSIGYYNAITSAEYLGTQSLPTEWESKIKPDYVACTGSLSKKLLSNWGVPNSKLISCASLRQLKYKNEKDIIKKSKNLLILLSLEEHFSLELLTKIFSINKFLIDDLKLKVSVKAHPMSNPEMYLKKLNIKKFPEEWHWDTRNIEKVLDANYCVLCMGTSAIFNAVLNKNLVIPVLSEVNLMDNDLDVLEASYPSVSSIEEIKEQLYKIFVTNEYNEAAEVRDSRQSIIDGTNPINESTLSSMLPK